MLRKRFSASSSTREVVLVALISSRFLLCISLFARRLAEISASCLVRRIHRRQTSAGEVLLKKSASVYPVRRILIYPGGGGRGEHGKATCLQPTQIPEKQFPLPQIFPRLRFKRQYFETFVGAVAQDEFSQLLVEVKTKTL